MQVIRASNVLTASCILVLLVWDETRCGDYVASCESCSKRARPVGRGRGAPLQVTWSGYPFERIAMDLIPNLPETANGSRHLLVVADYFTKWVEVYPLKRMDAATIASVFVSEFVSRFGAPETLHTDQGRNFESRLFKDVCQLLGIKKNQNNSLPSIWRQLGRKI